MEQCGVTYNYVNKVYNLHCSINKRNYGKWRVFIYKLEDTYKINKLCRQKCDTKRECLKIMMQVEKQVKEGKLK